MSLPEISIRRPIFITCVVILMMAVGFISMQRMPVDLFPNITFPIVMVNVPYPGAGPQEVETLISKPLEDEFSTLAGMKSLRSINKEGVSTVIAEFTLETDIKYAEQQIRDKIASARAKLPSDIKEPMVRRIDPADQPVLIIALTGDLKEAELYDLADQVIRPKIEQVSQVGLVEILGGRKREIRVELDRKKLKEYEISATTVVNRIQAAGQNIPAGRVDLGEKETVLRTLAEFKSVKDVSETVVNFAGNDVPVTVQDLGTVVDGLVDETSRVFSNGAKSAFLMVFRQSGANTINVADGVIARVGKLNEELAIGQGKPHLNVVRDGSAMIRANVTDVKESILIGIGLTLLVVFFFLGSIRSTLITGIALPNSLVGAFMLMAFAGFSVNVMSLLALSLAVGLLVDDAIVVRENIFRHMELGSPPRKAASEGTHEVLLAVVATTLTVIAVFGPIGFLQGMVGRFFREFGLTICFAMAISLFDAVTMAPMLSAYLGGAVHHGGKKGKLSIWDRTVGAVLRAFDRFQTSLEHGYGRVLGWTLKHPMPALGGAVAIFVLSLVAASRVPKTFLPPQDAGEFALTIELPPGSTLDATQKAAVEADNILRANREVANSTLIIGSRDGESNVAQFFVNLVPSKQRNVNTSDFKERIRQQMRPLAYAKPIVKDIDMVMGGQRPFNLNIVGSDLAVLEDIAQKVFAKLKDHPAMKDPELSYKPGKPEFQVVLDNKRAERLGVSTTLLGNELRAQIEGMTAAVFRENGREYDIRVRLKEDQRDLPRDFSESYVPNVNNSLIRLSNVAKPVETTGPATINRQDRGRYIQLSADMAAGGPGMGILMADIKHIFENEVKLPPGVKYGYVGQAENFGELMQNMLIAVVLGILFIYLVLASLYESFITPFTIMLVLPLATCGAFYALFFMGRSLDIFSMIGCVMLLGVATKNSILLVDCTNQLISQGADRASAIIKAGMIRLRPILMTSIALIAGMMPTAMGLNEASKQRTSMGIAIIGGLISSTLLTLVVIPAAYTYIDRFRLWMLSIVMRLSGKQVEAPHETPTEAPERRAAGQSGSRSLDV